VLGHGRRPWWQWAPRQGLSAPSRTALEILLLCGTVVSAVGAGSGKARRRTQRMCSARWMDGGVGGRRPMDGRARIRLPLLTHGLVLRVL
jgi:hypothetical protein